MKKLLFCIFLILLGISVYFFYQHPQSRSSATRTVTQSLPNEESIQPTVIAEGLSVPWSIVFLPDNSMLVTERAGTIRKVDAQGNLEDKPVFTITEVLQRGESGLHGITIHPEFSKNNYVYVYYTYQANGNQSLNKVVRFTYKDNTFTSPTTIVNAIPGALFHDGGRIKFGPDNFLYITTGDAQEPSLAQDTNSLAGKILRVTDTGEYAPGNQFALMREGSYRPEIYSFGHRNPQGITWDEKGQLWSTEHGPSGLQTGYDELNLIKNAANYGWPREQGDEKYAGIQAISAELHSGTDTWAPGGIAYSNGSVFFAGLRGQALYEVTVSGERRELAEHFKGMFGRIRDVVVGPDKMLYITTSNRDGRGRPDATDDKIIRIDPASL